MNKALVFNKDNGPYNWDGLEVQEIWLIDESIDTNEVEVDYQNWRDKIKREIKAAKERGNLQLASNLRNQRNQMTIIKWFEEQCGIQPINFVEITL